MASEFLQNIVFINLQLSDREKIERFISLSDLYSKVILLKIRKIDINFHKHITFKFRVEGAGSFVKFQATLFQPIRWKKLN